MKETKYTTDQLRINITNILTDFVDEFKKILSDPEKMEQLSLRAVMIAMVSDESKEFVTRFIDAAYKNGVPASKLLDIIRDAEEGSK